MDASTTFIHSNLTQLTVLLRSSDKSLLDVCEELIASVALNLCIVIAMADKSDPRMPSAVRHYVPPIVNPNDLPPDYSSLMAILLGMLGVIMRQKIASWLSLVFIAQAIALMKNPENDLKQIVMALTFAVMGIVGNYFGPKLKTTKT